MKRNYTKTIVIISILVALTAVGCYFSRPKAQTPKEIPPFVPTHEWKEILPGQSIPKGLKVRMDFQTHKKFAKLDDGAEDEPKREVALTTPKTEVKEEVLSEEDKLAKVISDALLHKDENHSHETPDEMKERVLLSLPEPLPELKHYDKLSEEEKKKIINTVWERRQKDIEEAMKSVRGDAEIMAERIQELREALAALPQQTSNATLMEAIQQNLNDIQWLILDVDNVEDFVKMKGEALLLSALSALTSQPSVPAATVAETIVTVATLYKNAVSITDLTPCQTALKTILPYTDSSEPLLRKKAFYALNVMVGKNAAMAEAFVASGGVRVLEAAMGGDAEAKKKALQLYRALGQYFPQRPELSTINVCSKLLQDLTHEEGAYELLEAYMQLLAAAKERDEVSCVQELKKSEGFMREMRRQYAALVALARKEVIEEGEEGYYTHLVHLLHGVFGKDIE
ncbi:hypothetical protein WA577_003416 [Blastocystis sp. JDR]